LSTIEPIGLHIGPHLIQGRSIEQGGAVTVVDVLFDEHLPCRADLSFQLDKLALNCSFFLLRVGAQLR
jgi:hypothetical protein